MIRQTASSPEYYFRRAAAALLAACDGLDSSQRLRSGRHLFPGPIRSGIDRLADLGARLGPGSLPAVRRRDVRSITSLVERPLFLGGVHKSGTTLLRNLCDGHEELVMLPVDGGFDLAFLRRISSCSLRERQRRLFKRMVEKTAGNMAGPLRWLYEPGGDGALPVEDLARWTGYFGRTFDPSPGGLLRVVAASFAAVAADRLPGAKKYWAHKATLNIPAAARLLSLFPRARFVEIQRDSRAIYASQRGKAGVKGRPFRPYYELLCLHEWKRASEKNRGIMDGRTYHTVRYEDLVSDCPAVMGGIARFLDIAPAESLCEPSIAGAPVRSNTAYGDLHGKAGSVSARSIERWRDVLGPDEIAMLKHFDSRAPAGIAGRVADPVVTLGHLAKLKRLYRGEENVQGFSAAQMLSVLAMRQG